VPIDFQASDRDRPVRVYRRNLPHWRQDGATYFVTFRLNDSLPADAVEYLRQLRKALLACGADDALYLEADRAYFKQMKHYLHQGWGSCFLRDAACSDVVRGALAHFKLERYQLGALAVRPNHVHALVRPLPPWELENVLHSWKSYTARRVNELVGRSGPLWQDESYDRLVRDATEFARTERYIRKQQGPADAG
jgi:REP element-mobilizing transposase RayT